MVKFLNKEEEQRIISAIKEAELQTSGEIRVHLDKTLDKDPVYDAQQVFQRLGMHRTEARNGVLIYLLPEQKKFAIIGDEGIDKVVPEHFWEDVRDLMQQHFREGAFVEGLRAAIALVGEKLKAYFPYQSDDENELPDEISYDS